MLSHFFLAMDYMTQQYVAQLAHGMKNLSFPLYYGSYRAKVYICSAGVLEMEPGAFLSCLGCFDENEEAFMYELSPEPWSKSRMSVSTLHDKFFHGLDEEEAKVKEDDLDFFSRKKARANAFWRSFSAKLSSSLREFFEEKYARKVNNKIDRLHNKKRKAAELIERGEFGSRDLYVNAKRFKSKE